MFDYSILNISSFSLTVFLKFFLIRKSKSSTNLKPQRRKTRRSNYRSIYYDFQFVGRKYFECNLSLGQFCRKAVVPVTNCPRSNKLGKKSSERWYSSGAIVRGRLLGVQMFGGKQSGWGPIIEGQLSGGNFLLGQLYLGTDVQGKITRWVIIQGENVWAPIIQKSIFLGGNCPDTLKDGGILTIWCYLKLFILP